MNQTEIDELRRLASVSREPRHGIGCIASDCALASAARNAIPRLLAALEEARAERDNALHSMRVAEQCAGMANAERDRARQKIQAMEEQAMADEDGMSMRPLDGRLRKVEAERDALKATLAKHAESERAWCELATERGAKLEALESSLAEMAVKLDEGIECYPSSPCNIFATLLELHGLWRGKPSARVQP